MKLSELQNLGPTTEERLNAVGVASAEELDSVGAIEAYRRLKERYPRETSLNALYAMVGALLDVRWTELPDEVRARAKAAVSD